MKNELALMRCLKASKQTNSKESRAEKSKSLFFLFVPLLLRSLPLHAMLAEKLKEKRKLLSQNEKDPQVGPFP